MEEHFDAIVVANAMSYAKLFDASNFQPVCSDDDVMAMGGKARRLYARPSKSGPLAVWGRTMRRDLLHAIRQHLAVQAAGRAVQDRVRRRARLSGASQP